MADRVPRARALRVAEALVEHLAPACGRIEIAGSIRRLRPDVKDIELVAAPKLRRDLLGEWIGEDGGDELRPVVERLVRAQRLVYRRRDDGQIIATGPRAYMLWSPRAHVAIDLFAVLPPAQWGAVFAIRTGPAEFSKLLVTRAREYGLRCEDGRLVRRDGTELATPEERDFLAACRVPWTEPEARRG